MGYAPRVACMARAVALDIETKDFVTIDSLCGDGAWRVGTLIGAVLPRLAQTALSGSFATVIAGLTFNSNWIIGSI